MTKQNNKNPDKRRKEEPRRDAASNALRSPLNRELRTSGNFSDADMRRPVSMNRNYLNDLYERSSI